MDAIRNPYAPGAGTPPPVLTGRDAQIAAFEVLLERLLQGRPARSQVITGLRGVGKTVLLNHLQKLAEDRGFQTAFSEITPDSQFRALVARMLRRALLAIDPIERLRERALRAAGVLKAFVLKLPEGYQFEIDVDVLRGRADSGDLTEDLAEVLIAVGEASVEHRTGVVLLLDEIQFLGRADFAALISAIHRVAQRSLPVTLVGAGLPQLPALAGEAKSYAERLFDFPVIGRLPEAAAREALEAPARSQNVRFEPGAVAAILRFTEGYPYFLQEYGKYAWDVAEGPDITLADVERAEPRVQAQLDDNFFLVRIGRTTPAELRYLSAMAALGDGPYRSGDVADRLGKPVTSLALLRTRLIEKGIVYAPSHGLSGFTVPRFADFLRRAHPFAG